MGGLLIHFLGRVPQVNDRVEIPNLELTVLTADERRAKQVQARKLPLEEGLGSQGIRVRQSQPAPPFPLLHPLANHRIISLIASGK